MGRSLPWTKRGVIAFYQVLIVQRGGREVMVVFDHYGVVRLGDDHAIPNCFHYAAPRCTGLQFCASSCEHAVKAGQKLR